MQRLILCFVFLFHSMVVAQWRSQLLPLTEFEHRGWNGVINPVNQFQLIPVQENGNYTLYGILKNGVVIEGFQAATLKHKNQVLCSWFIDEHATFENSAVTISSKSIWKLNESSGKYILCNYKDSLGCRWFYNESIRYNTKVNMHRYFDTDTIVKGRMFLPDPLSRANVLYGGVYRDRQDSSYAEIEAQMVERNLHCDFSGDSFRLKNRYLSFKEISLPANPHATTVGPMFFTRNDKRFEEVNVFYHLTELMKWWDTLGFAGYFDTVELDVHAYSGADESAFDPLTSPPSIIFGGGGVDDAEDADVAIHEYTHVVFNTAIPKSYIGTQRQAIEEGVCYFMSVAYSSRYTKNQEAWVYNWDGHNEFWNGRSVENNKVWPVSLTNQVYEDAQLFGAALYDLAKEMGYDSTVKLIMQSLPFFVANINMQDAANIMWRIDSVLNSGKNSWSLMKAFYPRNLLKNASSIKEKQQPIIISNTAAFAQGLGEITLYPLCDGIVQVLSVDGRVVMEIHVKSMESIQISSHHFVAGTYILQFAGRGYKILKM